MSAKNFLIFRLIIAFLLAGLVSVSITAGSYVIPLLAVVTAVIVMYALKKKVKDVLEDERDYVVGGKAARYALTAFSLFAGIAVIFLFALRHTNPAFELVGAVLAYSICGLLILYSLLFKYFLLPPREGKTYLIRLLMAAVLLIFIVFGLRLFSGEDDWLCQNGQWVGHGNPSAPMPDKACVK